MSRERMEDLLRGFEIEGWRLLDAEHYPRGNDDAFVLDNDRIKWGLRRGQRTLELEFHAFHPLGQRTDKLTDILYCIVPATDTRLYFDKLGGPEWRGNLKRFVALVGETLSAD